MKICFLASSFYPTIGGAESYALNIATGMAKQGHEVIVLTDTIQNSSPVTKFENVQILNASQYDKLYHDTTKIRWEQMYFGLLEDCDRLLHDRPINLIHANSQDSAIVGSMLSQALHVPLVCSMHEHDPEIEPFGEGRCRIIYDYLPIDRILVGSQYYYERAARFCSDKSRIALVYHGVNTDEFSPHVSGEAIRKRIGITDQYLIVSAGRLKQRKGHHELIQVVRQLRDRMHNFHVLIAGSRSSTQAGYAEELYKQIDVYGLRDIITIDENLLPTNMPEVYGAANLVIHPSYSEGLGLTVLEAMSCCVPVVTTRVTGIREILTIGDEALLVESPQDIDGLTNAVLRIYSDHDLREKLISNAFDNVMKRFSLERMIANTEKIYQEVVVDKSLTHF